MSGLCTSSGCYYPIATTFALELFELAHATRALQIAIKFLKSLMGKRTLDPTEARIRSIDDNSNHSDNSTIPKGKHCHNGPVWGWSLGFILPIYLHFDSQVPVE